MPSASRSTRWRRGTVSGILPLRRGRCPGEHGQLTSDGDGEDAYGMRFVFKGKDATA